MSKFNIGDLVICKKEGVYHITNEDSLCIVMRTYNDDSEINVRVIAGTTIDWRSSMNNFTVNTDDFKSISVEEYLTHVREADIAIVKSGDCDSTLQAYGKEGLNMNMDINATVEAPAIINLNGAYNKFDDVKENILDMMEGLFTEYGHPYNRNRGMQKIWDVYETNKSGLAALLSNHPNWDEEKLAIVFSQDFKRTRNDDAVKAFFRWIDNQLDAWGRKYEYKIHCSSYREIERAYSKLTNLCDAMRRIENNHWGEYGDNHRVRVDGMTSRELVRERDRIGSILDLMEQNGVCKDGMLLKKEDYRKLEHGRKFNELLLGYKDDLADASFAEKANEYAEPFDIIDKRGKKKGLGAVAGMKVSRIVGKFFKNYGFDKIVDMQTFSTIDGNGNIHERTKDMGWNGMYSAYADGINPFIIKRYTIISVNPIDYLTMSFGNTWASCHTIDKKNKRHRDSNHNYQGCYCSGTLSYMLDRTSLIMYTVDEKYKGTKFCLEDKIQRCVFCIDEDKILQSRLYPDGRETGDLSMSAQFRTIIQKAIADCVKENNLWTVEKGSRICDRVSISYGTHYTDYTDYSDGTVSFLKRAGIKKNYKTIKIGHNPICPSCGEEHEEAGELACDECRGILHCERCGCSVDEDDAIIDVDTGNVYCDSDCASRDGVRYCVNDDQYHSENIYEDDWSEEYFVDDLDSIHIGYDYHYENEEHANRDGWHYIESDNEWHREQDGEIFQCPECDEWFLLEDRVETADGYCCSDCAEDLLEEIA